MADSQSVTSSVTTQRGVRLHIQKQLARDIEANGGIQYYAGHKNHNLYRLLQRKLEEDGNPDDHPYGKRGDNVRTQLRKVVNRWIKKDNQGKYVSEVLNPWQIVQHSSRMPRTRKSQPDSDSSESSDDGTSAAATATRKANARTTSFQSPPPKQVLVDRARQAPTTPLTPIVRDFLNMTVDEAAEHTNPNKRKIGSYDFDSAASQAGKFL